jgi:molybdopterin synthase catalytic subunit
MEVLNLSHTSCCSEAGRIGIFAGTVKTAGNAAFVRRMKYLAFEGRARLFLHFGPLEVQITRKKMAS